MGREGSSSRRPRRPDSRNHGHNDGGGRGAKKGGRKEPDASLPGRRVSAETVLVERGPRNKSKCADTPKKTKTRHDLGEAVP